METTSSNNVYMKYNIIIKEIDKYTIHFVSVTRLTPLHFSQFELEKGHQRSIQRLRIFFDDNENPSLLFELFLGTYLWPMLFETFSLIVCAVSVVDKLDFLIDFCNAVLLG